MIFPRLRKAFSPVARATGLGLGIGLGIALGAWMLAPWPVAALTDTSQVLSGGQSSIDGQTRYLGPGTAFNNTIDNPAAGMGETAVSLPMFAGTVRGLRVNITTATNPTGGTFVLKVRKNGADTNLSCTLTASGTCFDPGKAPFKAGDLLSIQTVNTLADSGTSVFTYVLQFD